MDGAVGLIAGSGWASGVNLYAAALLLNLYGRLGVGEVPDVLLRTDVLVVAGVGFAAELVADKIPLVDSLWDAVHTVIRPLGGGVLALLLAGQVGGLQQAAAGVGGGGLALASHAAKATGRAALNASPEPATNVVVSVLEDGLVAGVVYLALRNPALAAVVVAVLLVVGITGTVVLWRTARRGLEQLRARRRQSRPGTW